MISIQYIPLEYRKSFFIGCHSLKCSHLRILCVIPKHHISHFFKTPPHSFQYKIRVLCESIADMTVCFIGESSLWYERYGIVVGLTKQLSPFSLTKLLSIHLFRMRNFVFSFVFYSRLRNFRFRRIIRKFQSFQ